MDSLSAIPDADPLALFEAWFSEARDSEPNDANAMALATATCDGAPSVRMVLLKDHGPEGFVFYTNVESRKGIEIRANPRAALLFHWKSLRRQIRIEGALDEVSTAMADEYFHSRALVSQLGSAASLQSRPLPDRQSYLDRVERLAARHPAGDIPRPPQWTGFRLDPSRIEFWLDRPNRLHDRRLFTRDYGGGWGQHAALPVTAAYPADRARLTRSAAFASIALAITLVALKSWAVWRTDSTAMLGSLADSALDLVASLATLVGVWIAAMPADEDHRFGHGKAEALAAVVQVTLIAISAFGIGLRAIGQLVAGSTTQAATEGIGVSVAAILGTLALLVWQRHVIARTGSLAVRTDHLHYQSDLLLNLAVIAALALDQFAGLSRADPLFGLAIAAWLGWGAWRAAGEAVDSLMDREWPEEKRLAFVAAAAAHPELSNLHDLRTRSSGAHDFVQFHVALPAVMSLREAHDIIERVEQDLCRRFPGMDLLIHIDPEGQIDEPHNPLVEENEFHKLVEKKS